MDYVSEPQCSLFAASQNMLLLGMCICCLVHWPCLDSSCTYLWTRLQYACVPTCPPGLAVTNLVRIISSCDRRGRWAVVNLGGGPSGSLSLQTHSPVPLLLRSPNTAQTGAKAGRTRRTVRSELSKVVQCGEATQWARLLALGLHHAAPHRNPPSNEGRIRQKSLLPSRLARAGQPRRDGEPAAACDRSKAGRQAQQAEREREAWRPTFCEWCRKGSEGSHGARTGRRCWRAAWAENRPRQR